MVIGEKLKEIRESRNVEQAVIAERLGVARKNIYLLEKRSDTKLSTLKRYIDAIGGDLKIFVDFEGNMINISESINS